MPLGKTTLLEKNLGTLKSFGVSEVVMSGHEWAREIKNAEGSGGNTGIRISYYEAGEGTAGMLVYYKKRLKETFLMMNGDILLEGIDIEDMYNFHKRHGGQATLGVAMVDDPAGLGSIAMKGSKITGFREKPTDRGKMSHLISGDVYFLEPGVCALVKRDDQSMEYDIFPVLAGQGELYGYMFDKNWVHLRDEKAYQQYLARLS